MTEADILQRLREMQADMNDAIEKMDASAFDTGMMRQIRAEQHDFYKEAADEIERLRAEVEALRAAIERHRLNIWGDHEVQHPEDVALYAALAAKE